MALKVAKGEAGILTQAVWLTLRFNWYQGGEGIVTGVDSVLAISLGKKTRREDLTVRSLTWRESKGSSRKPHLSCLGTDPVRSLTLAAPGPTS